MAFNSWVGGKNMVHTHCGILHSWKETMKPQTLEDKWKELEEMVVSDITQIQKDKCHVTCYPLPEASSSKSSDGSVCPGVMAESREVKKDHCWGSRTTEKRVL